MLVCAVLAFTSAAPRVTAGWFEAVVQLANASEAPGEAAPPPPVETRAQAQIARAAAPLDAAIEAPSRARAARPNARQIVPVSRLYLFHSALLC